MSRPDNSSRSLLSPWRCPGDQALLRDCRWEAFRASGPGGQKRNKTSSAVRIVHVPTGLSAIANESRMQSRNRETALQRLRHRLTVELRNPLDADSFIPPPGFTLDVGQRHEDYLGVLGLVLDLMAALSWSVSDTANRLNTSTGSLVRFLEKDPKAWAHVNQQRAIQNLRPLRPT